MKRLRDIIAWIRGNRRIVVAAVAALIIGYVLHWALAPAAGPAVHSDGKTAADGKPKTIWTCSMHPEIRLNEPGLCPKCHMELIPVPQDSGEDESPRRLVVTESAKALMEIETAAVERRFPMAEIRMVGKVDYDETRLAYITAWVPGRLDKLYVDFTGVTVNKGDHMVYLYSPQLLSAQEELIQAVKSAREMGGSDVGIMRESARASAEAARDKLRLMGLTPAQIEEIESSQTPTDHITIYAPTGGIVIHKNVQQGAYVEVGTRIYAIADLSQVWVKLDAYESDLTWLRYGQDVQFSTVAYPGEVFRGTVSFIDPVLDPATRTIKVRLDVPNGEGKLKPGMFVKAVAHSRISVGGKVMDPRMAGKWICPMHPSVIRDQAGACNICGMDLVTTESLGYVGADPDKAEKPLVIPVTAAMVTGTRAVVYVEAPGTEKPTYEGREIELGPRAGDYYLVHGGLNEGERVVARGNFKIDSALQIQAKPSMMSPEGAQPPQPHEHSH